MNMGVSMNILEYFCRVEAGIRSFVKDIKKNAAIYLIKDRVRRCVFFNKVLRNIINKYPCACGLRSGK